MQGVITALMFLWAGQLTLIVVIMVINSIGGAAPAYLRALLAVYFDEVLPTHSGWRGWGVPLDLVARPFILLSAAECILTNICVNLVYTYSTISLR